MANKRVQATLNSGPDPWRCSLEKLGPVPSHSVLFEEFLDHLLRHDEPLNLIGPFIDLSDLGVPHRSLDVSALEASIGAHDLDRIRGDLHGDIRREEFGHGGVFGRMGKVFVQVPCRLVDEGLGRLDHRGHVCKHELHALELGNGFPELSSPHGKKAPLDLGRNIC